MNKQKTEAPTQEQRPGWLWQLVRPFLRAYFWLKYSNGTQQKALNYADQLLRDAWAAGRKDGLQDQTDNWALPHEVRMFACDIANDSHHKAARALPRVLVQIGPLAITVSRSNGSHEPCPPKTTE